MGCMMEGGSDLTKPKTSPGTLTLTDGGFRSVPSSPTFSLFRINAAITLLRVTVFFACAALVASSSVNLMLGKA